MKKQNYEIQKNESKFGKVNKKRRKKNFFSPEISGNFSPWNF
jgi:hypothetical protein